MSQSITLPFAIGEEAWFVNTDRTVEFVTCPDCLGTRYAFVKLGNGEEFHVECDECDVPAYSNDAGWRIAGTVAKYGHSPKVERVTLGAVNELDGTSVASYLSPRDSRGSASIYRIDRLFRERAEADSAAACFAEKATQEENASYEQRMNYRRRAKPSDIARKPTWLAKEVRELTERLEKAKAALAYARAARDNPREANK